MATTHGLGQEKGEGLKQPTPEEYQQRLDNKVNEILPLLDGLSISQIETILERVKNNAMLLPLPIKY